MTEQEQEIRILIADDHGMFRDALRTLLGHERGFHVVGEAANGSDLIKLAGELKPDLVLLDLAMPQGSGLEVLRELSTGFADIRTIILTASIDRAQQVEALRLGARGVILKHMATQLLFKAVRAVMAGEYWIGHDGVAGIISSIRSASPADAPPSGRGGFHLSLREKEIVALVVEGCANKEIARQLLISEQTVKHHLTDIFAKVGVSNRLELALFAMHQRLQ